VALDREKIRQAAEKFVEKKRYDKAIVELKKLVVDDPGDVRTLLRIGDLQSKAEQYEDAIATYEQVGEYYYREGFSVKAIAVYKQIRGIIRRYCPHLEGRYSHIVPRLAEIYTQLGLTSDALAAYDEVATRLRSEGRERDALDIFKKVVELDPQNPIAHLRVADSRARLGDIDKAVERFAEAARLMFQLGRIDDALKVFERLLELRAEPLHAREAARLYLQRAGHNDAMAALTKLQIAYKANPKDLDTLALLARAFDTMNQGKKAIEVLKESARIAKEKGEKEAFNRLLDTLLERAPEDTLVARLSTFRKKEELRAQEDVEVVVSTADSIEAPADESLEEVFELEEGDIEGVQEEAASSDMFSADLGDEPSAVRRLLNAAERQRAGGNVPAAIALVRDGLRNLGTSHALRHKLGDLLLEAGDQQGCITEKLILAQEYANLGEAEPALEMLDEVLLLAPGHPDALQMRANLGFPSDGSVPLQSYDVESGGVEAALKRSRHPSSPLIPTVSLDEPFQSGQHQAIPAPPREAAPPMAERRAYPPPVMKGALDESALDQAESLAELGRFDEARALLHAQLSLVPNHPLILERLADLDALSGQGVGPSSGPYPIGEPSQPLPLQGYGPPPSYDYGQQQGYGYDQPHYGDQAYAPTDYGQQGYDAAYAPTDYGQQGYDPAYAQGYPGEENRISGPQLAPEVNAMLDQVRAGVKRQVSESDAATHYDLGVAYYEMGLHADAISELLLASRDGLRECVCLSMIARIHLDLGDFDAALDALHRAMAAPQKTPEQELALGYEIANTYEMKMMPEQALHYFEWLAQIDPTYADPRGTIVERIHRLRTESGAQRRPEAPEAPDGNEMQAAFDDVFEEGS
jgi:tetratricopeptide (TPR) repeat protein